jgi:hypothetical protein
MIINYKQPYWVKFQWDMSTHHDNQYVTEYNKTNNKILDEFLLNDNYIITCDFKITEEFITDEICMIYGKPGKNIGLSYNKTTNTMAFEFWNKTEMEETFNFIPFKDIKKEDIQKGLVVTIIKKENEIIVYKNFEENNRISFEGNLIDDYKNPGLFLGCSSPECDSENARYYCQVDINHFSTIVNHSDINFSKLIYQNETDVILEEEFYNDILFLHNFNNINNLGIIYDESKNTNFLERVPKEYIK